MEETYQEKEFGEGVIPEKRKLISKPLFFKNPRTSAIVGATKPIAGNSFMVKNKPVENTAVGHPFVKRSKKALA